MVPADASLLGEKRIIFVMLWVIQVDKCVGSHIAVVAIKVVEETGAE